MSDIVIKSLERWCPVNHERQYGEISDTVSNLCSEITALRAELEKWKYLDREAATHVESVICMKSNRFTAEPPYVGWKGLGLALTEDYAELSRLRAELERKDAALREISTLSWSPTDRETYQDLFAEAQYLAEAALSAQKEGET